jgi:hypothetical protein
MWRRRPVTGVTVDALRKEIEAFLRANGGLDDTWFWSRDELIESGEDVWPAVQLGIASEGSFFYIMNPHYGGGVDDAEGVCRARVLALAQIASRAPS